VILSCGCGAVAKLFVSVESSHSSYVLFIAVCAQGMDHSISMRYVWYTHCSRIVSAVSFRWQVSIILTYYFLLLLLVVVVMIGMIAGMFRVPA